MKAFTDLIYCLLGPVSRLRLIIYCFFFLSGLLEFLYNVGEVIISSHLGCMLSRFDCDARCMALCYLVKNTHT